MISVCIATYNGAAVVLTQLHSILSQLSEGDEVVVSDDASKDGTRRLVEEIGDSRIRLVDGPAVGSPVANFENALRHAKGDYIFLSDQDDKWLPGKVEACMEKLREGYDCVVTDCVVTDRNLDTTAPSFFELNGTRKGCLYNLLVKNGYLGCCMAFTRSVMEKSLPFPPDIPMHDIWIGNVAARYGRVTFVNKPYILFRRSGATASTTAEKSQNGLWRKIRIRWAVLRRLYLWG